MKFKILLVVIMILFITTACSKNEEKKKEDYFKQDVSAIETNEDNEIVKGTVEGYIFTEVDKKTDRVKIEMEDGSVILIVLSNSATPITIKNFKKLVSEKFYDGLIFHRVIDDFMIQGGDPTGTGMGGSDEEIKGEFTSNGVENNLSHTRGVISMARSSNPNSASSQFFIVQADSTYLDGSYASFGKVIAGMDVVDHIAKTKVDDNDKPLTEQKIKSIRFIEVESEE